MPKVADILTDETRWIKGEFAKDAEGNVIQVRSAEAVCFCLFGAIERCYNWDMQNAIAKKARGIGISNITAWNDAPERTFEEVRALITSLDI